MESEAVFEQRVVITPKELNATEKISINKLIMSKLRDAIENKCSKHGFVLPGTLEILSRSLGRVENGRFTGAFVYQVQARGKVLVPVDGAVVRGTILKKNKMGIYVYYKNAFRIMIPRDFHLGDQHYESLKIGDEIEVELKKSRFQIKDNYIISVGLLVSGEQREIVEKKQEVVVDESIGEVPITETPAKRTVKRTIRKPAMLSPIAEDISRTIENPLAADEVVEA
jgi:DNA-directed RNA polymerase subunit E'/Rpb7